VSGVTDLRAERLADVAADRHLETRRLEDAAGERGRRRFALRASNGDDTTQQPARRQLDFADDRHATRFRGGNRRLLRWNARAQHDEVGAGKRCRLMSAELELDAE
jgi:hypothetical protein